MDLIWSKLIQMHLRRGYYLVFSTGHLVEFRELDGSDYLADFSKQLYNQE